MTNFYATIARYYDSEHSDKTEDLVLYSELAEEFGDSIGESGVRAWTAQGNIPLRRRHQLARLGRSNDLLVDVVTLEVHFGPTGGDVGDSTHLGTAAFLSLDEVAARWSSNSNWPDRRTGIIERVEPRHGAAVLNQSESA
jgi:hypothetical protein